MPSWIAAPWLVVLTKQPSGLYPPGYFPRKFFTKEDALAMVARIRDEGGEAMLTSTEFCLGDDDGRRQ
jgi:hypothetical protein